MSILKKAIFFDRDGVLNFDTGYVYRYKNIRWIPGAREIIGQLTQEGWLLFVVTNQSGIARGFYTENDVQILHKQMNNELAKYGGHITEFFYCPHLKGAMIPEYDVDCNCRKPRPGMIVNAMSKYNLIAARTFLFGDSDRDIQAAKNAGIKGFLFNGKDLGSFIRESLSGF